MIRQSTQAGFRANANMVEEWEAAWTKLLAQLSPDGEETTIPTFMAQCHPTYLVPSGFTQDIWIEWVYTIDLDREIFSVNNAAHFKLEQMPHIDWMGALGEGRFHELILLPPLLPEGAIASVMAEVPPVGQDMCLGEGVATGGALISGLDNRKIEKGKARELLRRKVTPNDVDTISWRHRHGPVLRSMLFLLWSKEIEPEFRETLLQWSPDDFPFREFAFAALCLAAGDKHITVMPESRFTSNGIYGHVDSEFENAYVTGFFSVLATGAHYKGGPAGSAPEETIYWLDDVLVFLTTQLYRDDAMDEEISRVVKHCQVHYPDQVVDAVLTSIEHVILVHVIPGSEVQHTGLLPFIKIKIHFTTDVQDRYTNSYLNRLAGTDRKKVKKQKKSQQDAIDAQNIHDGVEFHSDKKSDHEEESESEEEEGDFVFNPHRNCVEKGSSESSTFYALTHLFDAAAVRHLPYTTIRDGRLPNKLYPKILHYVTDLPTRTACMKVSRLFRRICQEDLLFTEGIILPPCKGLQNLTESSIVPKWFDMQDLEKEESVRVNFKKAGRYRIKGNEVWRVAVGTARNGKSMLEKSCFELPAAKQEVESEE